MQNSTTQHTTTLRVRYDECDPMGLVHHSQYLKYFEIGRTEFFRASGGRYRDVEAAGLFVVVAHIDCRYRAAARYDDVIEITTRITKVTAAKIVHEYQIRRVEEIDNSNLAADVLVDATVTLAVINRDGQLQRVPDELVPASLIPQ